MQPWYLTAVCAFSAGLIAAIITGTELLNRHQVIGLKDIFRGYACWLFIGLNFALSTVFYIILPKIKDVLGITGADFLFTEPWRILVAGFGYQALAHSSIGDFKTARGEVVGVGFDAIYKILSQRLLKQHQNTITHSYRLDFLDVYDAQRHAHEPMAFLHAVEAVAGTDNGDRQAIQAEVKVALEARSSNDIVCQFLYRILRSQLPSKEATKTQIQLSRKILTDNSDTLDELQKRFEWLKRG
jgi:hypothetical protein